MLKRSVVVSNRAYIFTKDEQLVIENRTSGEIHSVAIEDIGYLELQSTQATISVAALSRLAANCVAVGVCNESYHPVALHLPLSGNTLHTERIVMQTQCPLPTKKRIWQHLVQSKIKNQELVGKGLGYASLNLSRYSAQVLTADRTNREAAAAKVYWSTVLKPLGVSRDAEGPYPNNALNYGYAVVRAAVARGLVAAGLHPALGIHHSNRYNAYALADDVMEPYRPFVDYHVLEFCARTEPTEELTPDVKKHILGILVADVHHRTMRRPLANSVETLCAQLVQALQGNTEALDLPKFHA